MRTFCVHSGREFLKINQFYFAVTIMIFLESCPKNGKISKALDGPFVTHVARTFRGRTKSHTV